MESMAGILVCWLRLEKDSFIYWSDLYIIGEKNGKTDSRIPISDWSPQDL